MPQHLTQRVQAEDRWVARCECPKGAQAPSLPPNEGLRKTPASLPPGCEVHPAPATHPKGTGVMCPRVAGHGDRWAALARHPEAVCNPVPAPPCTSPPFVGPSADLSPCAHLPSLIWATQSRPIPEFRGAELELLKQEAAWKALRAFHPARSPGQCCLCSRPTWQPVLHQPPPPGAHALSQPPLSPHKPGA